ncbi:DUF5302 domain-containing protein [Yinghuangia seranimata]|uniref:DUF5302 domain-containing protein n=1 Tax=Yinghuangia seranimata TaxID=408067 RepID=UPI00248C4BF8|nr:DUF5302 domain-containing protein [Yinghuangia seranimata]MDI2131616.1 DUF5302 domain-containing protein [Yinghuangia seranimata]
MSDESNGAAAGGAADDVKRKFREALDRKRGVKTDAVDVGQEEHPKVHGGAHGPAAQQRAFQRKSGG